MLKIRLTATETVLNFQEGFGGYGMFLVFKIDCRHFDCGKLAVLDAKLASLT